MVPPPYESHLALVPQSGVNIPITSQQELRHKQLSLSGLGIPDFVYPEEEANTVKFGAFRSFDDFAQRSEKAREDAMKISPESLRLKRMSEALPIWWEHVKEPTVRKQRTKEAYALYMRHLENRLGPVILAEMNIGHVLEYQRERHKVEGASVWFVNHETNTLSQLMRYADLWDRIAKYFKPLPPPEWEPPKVLTHEEEEYFFKVVASNPEWRLAYWALSISNNTSAVGCELINLQLKHVFLDHVPPKIHIPDGRVKNEFRARVIPLNEVAAERIRRVIARAEEMARKQGFPHLYAEHYIFPFGSARNRWDVTKPASRYFIYNHFKQMRKVTGFKWLKPRNFRNQLITKLFEHGTPDETITSIAGHASIKMSRYYSKIRIQAKYDALSAIAPKSATKKAVENAG